MNTDQTAPRRVVGTGSMVFAMLATKEQHHISKQRTIVVNGQKRGMRLN